MVYYCKVGGTDRLARRAYYLFHRFISYSEMRDGSEVDVAHARRLPEAVDGQLEHHPEVDVGARRVDVRRVPRVRDRLDRGAREIDVQVLGDVLPGVERRRCLLDDRAVGAARHRVLPVAGGARPDDVHLVRLVGVATGAARLGRGCGSERRSDDRGGRCRRRREGRGGREGGCGDGDCSEHCCEPCSA